MNVIELYEMGELELACKEFDAYTKSHKNKMRRYYEEMEMWGLICELLEYYVNK